MAAEGTQLSSRYLHMAVSLASETCRRVAHQLPLAALPLEAYDIALYCGLLPRSAASAYHTEGQEASRRPATASIGAANLA